MDFCKRCQNSTHTSSPSYWHSCFGNWEQEVRCTKQHWDLIKQKKMVKAIKGSLSKLRKEGFCQFWNAAPAEVCELELNVKEKEPPPPRQRKTPRRQICTLHISFGRRHLPPAVLRGTGHSTFLAERHVSTSNVTARHRLSMNEWMKTLHAPGKWSSLVVGHPCWG